MPRTCQIVSPLCVLTQTVIFQSVPLGDEPPGIPFDVTFRVFTRNVCGNQE